MLKGFILCINNNNNNNNKKRPVTEIQILWYMIDSNERNNTRRELSSRYSEIYDS